MSDDFNDPDSFGQHVGMHIAPIVAVHRATGISVTVSDVERSQLTTRNKAQGRLMTVLHSLRSQALTADEVVALEWVARLARHTHCEHGRDVAITALRTIDRLTKGTR